MTSVVITGLSADCGLSYQPLRPQSPRNKGKGKERTSVVCHDTVKYGQCTVFTFYGLFT